MPADPDTDAGKAGPAMPEAVEEVQAIFADQDRLEAAMGALNASGFDRADFSLPAARPSAGDATPNAGAENPTTREDRAQIRTMGSSMAAASAAMVGAGIVLATGGLALPAVAVAAGAGLAAGGAVEGMHHASDTVQRDGRAEAAAAGELVLAVRLKDPAQLSRVEAVLREHGAVRVERVSRGDEGLEGVNSASWTG